MAGEKAGHNEQAEIAFARRGMQYYIGGRFLALSQQFPVCANLLHHAVEMFLKSALCRTHSPSEVRALQHNLRKAWLALKAVHPDPRLNSIDSAVSDLNKFERARYPDEELKKGFIGTFALEHAHFTKVEDHSATPSPRYALVLEDVDHLVQLIFEVGGMDPRFHLNSASASVVAVLNDQNAHPFPTAT